MCSEKLVTKSPDDRFVEIIETPDHPWFPGCRFHSEFNSRPLAPHLLFRDFIGGASLRLL